MYRTLLFWTGAFTLGAVAMWFAAPNAVAPASLDLTVCKVRNVVRRRRTRKPAQQRLRAYTRESGIPHLPRHAPCNERQ